MRKLLTPALGMLLVLVLACVGIFAHLESSQACLDDIIRATTFDLQIRDQNHPGFGDSVAGTWTANNMKPGDSFPFSWLAAHDSGRFP